MRGLGIKKSLHLRREQDAGRLNKHTMRKLSPIYFDFSSYKIANELPYLMDYEVVGLV